MRQSRLEVVCVVIVLVALAALLAAFVLQAGGGVINQG
jgi:hypothetical protein